MEEPNSLWPSSSIYFPQDDNLQYYESPLLPVPDGVGISPPGGQSEPPSGDGDLPLLRLGDWDQSRQYDKNNPECIHYDFKWKVSVRGNIRAQNNWAGSSPDIVLAPSDHFKVTFQKQLEDLRKDKEKFPEDKYICVETNVNISVERTRGRGLSETFTNDRPIDWETIDSHLEALGALFSVGTKMDRKITFSIGLMYKEDAKESTATKKRKKTKSTTEAQHAELAKNRGIWKRVFEHWQCRGSHCKQGPHCYRDRNGNHRRLEAPLLVAICKDIVSKMKGGENEEEVEIPDEIPGYILEQILMFNRKEQDDDDAISGDAAQRLEQYCIHILGQTKSDRYRRELEKGAQWAIENCLELNSALQQPDFVVRSMVDSGVKTGIAVQLVSKTAIKEWWRIQRERDQIEIMEL